MYFLPQNPCCNSTPLVNTVPCVGGNPCSTVLTQSEYIAYSGPNLPCTGIQTCDTLTVALQKADEQICNLINTTIDLQNQIFALTTTTTTTTIAPPTTTTTTTLPPGIYAFEMKYSEIGGTEACAEVSSSTYYSNSATLNLFSGLATDVALTISAPAGYYCLATGCPNSTGKQWIQVGGGGSISGASNC